MLNIRAKIRKSIRQRGLSGTIRMSLYNVAYYAGKLTPRALYETYKEREFDRRFKVDTSGRIDLTDLGDVDGVAVELGTRYEPIDPATFAEVMERLKVAGVDIRGTTFVDYGCGKGRALLLASHYPFARIVGIEISATLSRVALANIASYEAPNRACSDLSVEQADALEWEPPHSATLFYFYHPFEEELLGQVLERIQRSIRNHPRTAYLLYVGMPYGVLDQPAFLRPISVQNDREPQHGIYECR